MKTLRAALAVVLSFLVVSSNAAGRPPLSSQGRADNAEPATERNAVTVTYDKSKHAMQPVLTLDGGGLRGIIIVEVLAVVENSIKKALRQHPEEYGVPESSDLEIDLADFFTAMSGVNCGCWIASYLASKCGDGSCSKVFNDRYIIGKYGVVRPGSIDGLKVFFLEYGNKIYRRPNIEAFTRPASYLQFPFFPAPGLTCPSHPTAALKEVLETFLGEASLAKLHCILFIPAFDLIRGSAVIFVSGNYMSSDSPSYTYILGRGHNVKESYSGQFGKTVKMVESKKYRLSEVVRAGSASPGVHEATRFSPLNDASFEFYCIDSSLLMNNPTLQTLVFLSSKYNGQLQNISILSIGTGIMGGSMADRAESGAMGWMITSRDLMTVCTDGSSELIQAQIDMFFYNVMREVNGIRRGQYLRVQTSADETRQKGAALATLDSTEMLEELQIIGKDTGNIFRKAIEEFVSAFIFGHDAESHQFDTLLMVEGEGEEEEEEEKKKKKSEPPATFPSSASSAAAAAAMTTALSS